MKLVFVRLSLVALDAAISDSTDRNTMPMSTIIASDEWLAEAGWDGFSLGDVQIFKNKNFGRKSDEGEPLPAAWSWWGAVPRGKIKNYKFADAENLIPQTVPVTPEELPFETDGKRETKPGEAGKGRTPSA